MYQCVDPTLDRIAFLALGKLTAGRHFFVGTVSALDLLGTRPKPLVIVLATDAPMAEAESLRCRAMLHQVPVVHSLPSEWMGRAVGSAAPQHVVAVMWVPPQVRNVVIAMMEQAALACAAFSERLKCVDVGCFLPSQHPVSVVQHPAVQPCQPIYLARRRNEHDDLLAAQMARLLL